MERFTYTERWEYNVNACICMCICMYMHLQVSYDCHARVKQYRVLDVKVFPSCVVACLMSVNYLSMAPAKSRIEDEQKVIRIYKSRR